MIRPGARGAARDFTRALDGADGPARTPQTDEALRVVAALSAARHDLEAQGPRPEFRDALRTRLVAVATVQPVPEPARRASVAPVRHHVRRRTVLAAGALAGVVAVTGVAVAASRSLPGDPFYGTKVAAQTLQLRVEGGSAAEQGLRRLQLATERLSEVEAAVGAPVALRGGGYEGQPLAAAAAGSDAAVLAALADMDQEVRTGSQLMFGSYRVDHDAAPVVTVEDWASGHADRIAALLPHLSGPVRTRAEASLSLAREAQVGAAHLLATVACTAHCPPARTTGPTHAPSTGPGAPSPTATSTPGRSGGGSTGGSSTGSSSNGTSPTGGSGSGSGAGSTGGGGSSSPTAPGRAVPAVPGAGRVAPTAPGLPPVPLPSASAPRATAPGVPVPSVGGSLPAVPGGTLPVPSSGITPPRVDLPGSRLPALPPAPAPR